MKILNKKGFTLIELLAVIVVLSIILVITVPTVLNTLEGTREDALQASATSSAKYYHQQLQMILLGTRPDNFLVDAEVNYSTDTVNAKAERCISVEEADILGLNKDDYSINEGCKVEGSSLSSVCNTTTNYSTVKWTSDGNVTVRLVGETGGKFVKGNTPLVAVSSSIGNNTNLTTFGPMENVILTNTKNGKDIRNLKLYGNTVDGNSVGERTNNLFDCYIVTAGDYKLNSYISNSSGTTVNSNSYNGQIEVTQTNYSNTTNLSHYQNGYFTIGLSGLEDGKTYTMFYDFEVLSNPLNVSKDYLMINGKVTQYNPKIFGNTASVTFTWDGTASPSIEFRLAGKSMIYKNFMIIEGEIDTFSKYEPFGYKIPIMVSGKNLFEYKKAHKYEATLIEELGNGAITNGNDGNYSDFSSGNGWFYPGSDSSTANGVILYEGDIVTVSADVTLLEVGEEGKNLATRIYLYTRGKNSGYAPGNNFALALNEKTRISNTFTITTGLSGNTFYPVFTLNTHTMKIENIQIEKGSTATAYEPYQEPETYEIVLNEPLRSNGEKKDYIDFELGKVVRWFASDGSVLSTPTEEAITLPQIKTLNGTTILSTDTTVKPLFEGSY